MNKQDFTTSISVSQPPEKVFDAINNVRGWWSQAIDGKTSRLNSVFDYHYKDVHRCKIKIVESVPGKKIVWHVLENYFNFTKDNTEWTDTRISFEISKQGEKTQLTFTHIGLVPDYECFGICSDAWGNYIRGSLKNLIETGTGQPNPYETAIKNAASLRKENKK